VTYRRHRERTSPAGDGRRK